jgi:hypothetical protein
MKFGTKVLIHRGGHEKPKPGQYRYVKATYIGASGCQVLCRLDQDDPDATVGYCTKKGDVGMWGRSIITKLPRHNSAPRNTKNRSRTV